jgi:molybdenum cofactor biosynthesis enzyme MoaA
MSAHTTESRPYYKGYYMITSRCTLDCDYCVLENSPEQIARELSLGDKKALIEHLYGQLNFRSLTLSGGEAMYIGERPPKDFLALCDFLRGFRSADPKENLELHLYSNGTLLDERVADAMAGVFDLVAMNIDSTHDALLARLGRSTERYADCAERTARACGLLSERGIRIKLHSVVGRLNHQRLPSELPTILDRVLQRGATVESWKFYQYMSYDVPAVDQCHAIGVEQFAQTRAAIEAALQGSGVRLLFKDNALMQSTLFNILPYGNAQFMLPGDTWSTSRRTADLRSYGSMEDLAAQHGLDLAQLRSAHGLEL